MPKIDEEVSMAGFHECFALLVAHLMLLLVVLPFFLSLSFQLVLVVLFVLVLVILSMLLCLVVVGLCSRTCRHCIWRLQRYCW